MTAAGVPGRLTCLVVPGSSERMLVKARELDPHELIIDLEDAVVPDRKTEARVAAVGALATGGLRARTISVRINGTSTAWAAADIAALGAGKRLPDSIVVPKVEGAGDLEFVDRALEAAGARIGVQALIESARGLQRLTEITGASASLQALVLGYADMAVSLGRSPAGAADLDLWLAAQDAVLVAARASGLQAIDGPYLAIDDADGLRASAARAAQLGFDGKWAIHPSQLQPIVEAFTPSDAEVQRAQAVLAALASGAGAGAVVLDGAMIDEPVRLAALRTLARAGREPEGSG